MGEFILSVAEKSLVFKQFLCSGDFFGYFLHQWKKVARSHGGER